MTTTTVKIVIEHDIPEWSAYPVTLSWLIELSDDTTHCEPVARVEDLLKARRELSDLRARIATLAKCGTQVLYGDTRIPTSMVSVYAVSSLLE